MAVDYKKIEFSLYESLMKIEEAYRLLNLDEGSITKINECKTLVETKRYSVAVMGEFKRGKSTLINALLGSKILPADATPTTATINRITFAPTQKAVIKYKDDSVEEIGIDRLADYVTKLTADGETRALGVKEAIVYFPTQICQNHVDIIDTPGLNDEERMTKITIDMLDSVDGVIVPIHARAPFSATEKLFVCQLLESENIHNIIFVITYMDTLDEDDYEYDRFLDYIRSRIKTEVISELERRSSDEKVLKKAEKILENINLFAVSSALALKSFVTNNRADLKKSGFEEFNTKLLHIITAKQIENTVRKSTEEINILIDAIAPQNEKRIERLQSSIKEMDSVKSSISIYGDEAIRLLNSLFDQGFDKQCEVINSLNPYKNTVVSTFIKSLSTIKSNTHNDIKETLSRTAEDCERVLNEEGFESVRQSLLQQFADDISIYEKHRSSTLLVFLPSFNIPEPADTPKIMLDFAEKELQKLTFGWTRPIIPNVYDLAACDDIMETVIYSVDSSIRDIISKLEDTLNEIRKTWFSLCKSEAASIMHLTDKAYQKEHDSLDRQLKAQIHNYQTVEHSLKDIVSRCSRLESEVRSAEYTP